MQTFDSRITRFYCGFSKIKALFQSKFGIYFSFMVLENKRYYSNPNLE